MKRLMILAMVVSSACAWGADEKAPNVVTNASLPAMLWNPAETLPLRSAMPEIAPVTRVTIHRAVEGEYQFLHGVCLAEHKGRIFACWTNSKRDEDPSEELVRGRWSDDGGKTWGALETVAGSPPFKPPYGHGTLLSHDGNLWAFVARFDQGGQKLAVRMEAFVRNDATAAWSSHGLVAENFWVHESPRPLPGGGWIVGGAMGPYPGFGPGVARIDGTDVTRWQVVPIPIPYGATNYYAGETTVWVGTNELTAIIRNPIHDVALLSVSRDGGRTWSPPRETNFPMAESKACAGMLSAGQRYLVCNSGNRTFLVIAASRPGKEQLDRIWMLRQGCTLARWPTHSKSPQWSYPWTLETGGNLLVAYSAAKEDAEVSIIPVAALR